MRAFHLRQTERNWKRVATGSLERTDSKRSWGNSSQSSWSMMPSPASVRDFTWFFCFRERLTVSNKYRGLFPAAIRVSQETSEEEVSSNKGKQQHRFWCWGLWRTTNDEEEDEEEGGEGGGGGELLCKSSWSCPMSCLSMANSSSMPRVKRDKREREKKQSMAQVRTSSSSHSLKKNDLGLSSSHCLLKTIFFCCLVLFFLSLSLASSFSMSADPLSNTIVRRRRVRKRARVAEISAG